MNIKSAWRLCGFTVLILSALVFTASIRHPALGQVKSPVSDIQPFLGTWTAVHAGTPIIVLHLQSDNDFL